MDDEDFLDAIVADNANTPVEEPKPEPETPAEPEATPEPEQPAPEEPAPSEPVNPLIPPVLDAKPDPGFVPISVVLDEREKRQKAEARAAELEAKQQPQQPQAIPDRWEDPEGFDAYQGQQLSQALYEQNLHWSERIASIQHGEETVKQAHEWGFERCAADPYFNAKVKSSPDPIGFVVSEWKREQIASQVTPDDFAQFQAWKAAQAELNASAQQPPGAAPPNPSRSVPPRSLASAPSAGGVTTEVAQTDEEIFEEVASRK